MLKKMLSHSSAIALLELIQMSLRCADAGTVRDLMSRLSDITPFDYAACGIADIGSAGTIGEFEIVNISYPSEWLQTYVDREYYEVDPIVKKNYSHFGLQYWDDTYKAYNPPKGFISEACEFGLEKGYTYGVRSTTCAGGSIFSFAGKSIERNRRTEIIMNYVIPHFHLALSRALKCRKVKADSTLTSREIEVLKWLKAGKSTHSIGAILNISENTVKYHLKSIMRKLGAHTRSHAVAVALESGLLDLE